MINQYKREDVFRCNQEAHKRFGGKVSVHHVLKEKSCYPQGCLYFQWHCVLLEKGERCIHRYRHVGRNCKGCTYYIEEKIHLQPELLLTGDQYSHFIEALEDFETWLDCVRFKRHTVGGEIDCIKPWFEKNLFHKSKAMKLHGYLLVFKKGFVGTECFDDTFYARVSANLMRTICFQPKMVVEMEGELDENRGRIIVRRLRKIEVLKGGGGEPLNREQALVAIKTSTQLAEQSEQCLACPWGALVDVIDLRNQEERRYRNLYCLKGIAHPEGCYVQVSAVFEKN